MATKLEEAREALALLNREAGILPFYTKNVEAMATPEGFEAMDGEHYDIVALQHNMGCAVEVMQHAATVLAKLTEPVEHDVDAMAWRLLGDPAGQGNGWIGYSKLHADMVKGIKAGIEVAS